MRLWYYALAATVLLMWGVSVQAAVPPAEPSVAPPDERPAQVAPDASRAPLRGGGARESMVGRGARAGRGAGAALERSPGARAGRPEPARGGRAGGVRRMLRNRANCPAPWCPLGLRPGRGAGFGARWGVAPHAARRLFAGLRRHWGAGIGARPKAGLGAGRGGALRERLRSWSQPERRPGLRDRAGRPRGDQVRARGELRDQLRELRRRLERLERELNIDR